MSELKTKIKEILLKQSFDLSDLQDMGTAGWDHLKEYGQQGMDHLKEYGQQGIDHLKNFGQESLGYLQDAGQQGLETAKENPGMTAAGLGAGVLGMAGTIGLKRMLQQKLLKNKIPITPPNIGTVGGAGPGIIRQTIDGFKSLPTSSKLAAGAGLGALGYMGYNALTENNGNHKKTITIS